MLFLDGQPSAPRCFQGYHALIKTWGANCPQLMQAQVRPRAVLANSGFASNSRMWKDTCAMGSVDTHIFILHGMRCCWPCEVSCHTRRDLLIWFHDTTYFCRVSYISSGQGHQFITWTELGNYEIILEFSHNVSKSILSGLPSPPQDHI